MKNSDLEKLNWADLPSSQINMATWVDVLDSAEYGLNEAGIEWKDLDSLALDQREEPQPHLLVEFKGGGTYAYRGASIDVFIALCQAESPGRFLASDIKRRFPYTKLVIE